MLSLPPSFSRLGTYRVIQELLGQARCAGRYSESAQMVVRAAIDFMLAGPRWKDTSPRPRLTAIQNGWRLNQWVFYILPELTDDALSALADLPKAAGDADILTPPRSRDFVDHALHSAYPKRAFSVYPIDSYCELRLGLTACDMKISFAAAGEEFLARYRQLTSSDPEICIPATKVMAAPVRKP